MTKKLLTSISLLLALAGAATTPALLSAAPTASRATVATAVYMCANGKTQVYHSNRDCAALRRCSHEVKSLTAGQAQTYGLRGCMKCY